jgi:hypothetical protein
MTKRDYERLARAMRAATADALYGSLHLEETRRTLAVIRLHVSGALLDDDKRLDRQKFLDACLGTEG